MYDIQSKNKKICELTVGNILIIYWHINEWEPTKSFSHAH